MCARPRLAFYLTKWSGTKWFVHHSPDGATCSEYPCCHIVLSDSDGKLQEEVFDNDVDLTTIIERSKLLIVCVWFAEFFDINETNVISQTIYTISYVIDVNCEVVPALGWH